MSGSVIGKVAIAFKVPLGGDDRAGPRRHLDECRELDRLADRDLGTRPTVGREFDDRLNARRAAAVCGKKDLPIVELVGGAGGRTRCQLNPGGEVAQCLFENAADS